MKNILYLLLLSIFVLGCRKGKKMPEITYIHYEGPTIAGVYPQGAFPLFNPYDINEIPQYPQYVDSSKGDDFALDFNDRLAKFLIKNNVFLTTGPAEYSLKINSLGISESLYRDSYIDSCSWSNASTYFYYSKLNVYSNLTLSKDGVDVGIWDENVSSRDRVREKRDHCNKPKILQARSPNALFDQLAKEIRVIVSKKLYELEVN